MGDGLEQGAIECPKLTPIFCLRFGFDGRADQLIQLLTFTRVMIEKLSQTFGVRKQAFTPLLGLMVMPFFICIHPLQRLQLRLQGVSRCQPHPFADELQLASSRFVLFRGHRSEKCDGVSEAIVFKFNALKLSVGEFCQLFAQRLQRGHLALHRTLGRALERVLGIDIVFFKGASICHGY